MRRNVLDAALIAAAILVQAAPLPPSWIENGYANGIYAALARTFVPLSNQIPFAAGDVLLIVIVLGFAIAGVRGWRRPRTRRLARVATLLLRGAAGVAAILLWFDVAWALNYRRAPIVARVADDPARVTPPAVAAFGDRIARELDAAAPAAHGRTESEAELERNLVVAFEPVIARLGDRFPVAVSRPKTTIFNWWFALAGVGGEWDPFAYETLLNADFLWFERPFALAHEWGHVGGFGDESDANLIAALTTLRSADPVIRYSGLFWTFGFLPDAARRESALSPLVRADLAASRARFLRHYNPRIFALQWFVYDKYLRANRVRAGVVSYSLFIRVLVGTPLDAQGLPLRSSRFAEPAV